MKDSIKIGDLFIVYEMPDHQPQGFWYQFGKDLGILVQSIRSFLIRSHSKTTRHGLISNPTRVVDYSKYETPTVYRKWR